MTMERFDGVPWIFFDLDDTLWNFTANSAWALRELYKVSPILRKLFKDLDEFIKIYHQNNSLMWDLYSQGKVTTRELKTERWRRTLATRQFEVLTAVCEELDTTYLEILARGQEKIEGVDKMLGRLSKKYMLAVLSNGFRAAQYKKLRYSGLERYITRTIVSEEIEVNKPDPRIFRYAVEETGAKEPYLMVGDNAKTDILGAMRAGWRTVWYNPSEKSFPYSDEELKEMGIDPALLVASVNNPLELEKILYLSIDIIS